MVIFNIIRSVDFFSYFKLVELKCLFFFLVLKFFNLSKSY